MKKMFFILLFAVLYTPGIAQYTPDAFANRINYIFQYVDKDAVPSGILREYGLEFLSLDNYNGQILHDSNYVGNKEWINLYTSLYSSQVRILSSLPSPQSVAETVHNLSQSPTPFLILNYQYDTYRDDAVSLGLVNVVNDQILPGYTKGLTPYEARRAFAVSPFKNVCTTNGDLFIFKPELYFSNTGEIITAIEVDKGNGYYNVNLNSPFSFGFTTAGIFNINIRVTFSNGVQLLSHTKIIFKPQLSSQFRWSVTPSFTQSISGTKPYLGQTGNATAIVHLSTTNTTGAIRRPFIVAEPFDPWRILDPNDPNENWDSEDLIEHFDFGTTTGLDELMDAAGYDLIYIDYENGTDYIQRNAFVVDAVIRWVNSVKTTWNGVRQQNVIMGMSMGGLVTRYALRDMELNSTNHECRLFISFDSPQQGANVPLGLQMALKHTVGIQINVGLAGLFSVPIMPSYFIRPLQEGNAVYNSPAATQMLIQRVAYTPTLINPFTISNAVYTNFQNELAQMGWPQNVRSIAVSNGICSDELLFPDLNPRMLTLNGELALSYLTQLLVSTVFSITGITNLGTNLQLPLSLLSTRTSFAVDFWVNAVPPNFANEQIYNMELSIHRKILDLINVNQPIVLAEGYSGTSSYPLDNSPGGTYDFEDFGVDPISLQGQLLGFPYFLNFVINQNFFSFIPRFSSLNISDPFNNLRNDICLDRLVCEGSTPFDGYYVSPTDNEGHISMNEGNSQYVFSQAQEQMDCSSICPDISGNYTVCSSEIYTATFFPGAVYSWTPTSSSIATINSSGNIVTITRIGSQKGLMTLSVAITLPCGTITITKDIEIGSNMGTPDFGGFTNGGAFCEGNSFNAYANSIHYNSYLWTAVNGQILSGQGTYTCRAQVDMLPYWQTSGTFELHLQVTDGCNEPLPLVVKTATVSSIAYTGCFGGSLDTKGTGGIVNENKGEQPRMINKSGENPVTHKEAFKRVKGYPNPANDMYTIQLPEKYIGGSLKLTSMNGSTLLQTVISSTIMKVNVSKYIAGVYLAELSSISGEKEKLKIVVVQ